MTTEPRNRFVMFFDGGTRQATRRQYQDARRRARKSASVEPMSLCRYMYPAGTDGWISFIAYIHRVAA